MNKEQEMVRSFHEKFGFTLNTYPTLIDSELGKVRHFHTEKEMDELLIAIENENLVKIADALCDILYFTYGTGVAYGIDLEPIFTEIHRSNMTKQRPDPIQYVDAKAVKGEAYSPPTIESIIRKQKKPKANHEDCQ